MFTLSKVIRSSPNENSKPAIPKTKKVKDIIIISSFIIPNIVDNVYNKTQINSAINSMFKKLLLFKDSAIIETHIRDKK